MDKRRSRQISEKLSESQTNSHLESPRQVDIKLSHLLYNCKSETHKIKPERVEQFKHILVLYTPIIVGKADDGSLLIDSALGHKAEPDREFPVTPLAHTGCNAGVHIRQRCINVHLFYSVKGESDS